MSLYKIVNNHSGSSLFGFINEAGKVVVEPEYNFATDFSEGVAYFEKRDSSHLILTNGLINEEGEVYTKFDGKVTLINSFSDGLAYGFLNGNKAAVGFINKLGECPILLKEGWRNVHSFSEGLAVISLNETLKYINKDGADAFDLVFEDFATPFNEGIAIVSHEESDPDNFQYLNRSGELFKPSDYIIDPNNSIFSEGLAPVICPFEKPLIRKKYAFIDQFGNQMIETEFVQVSKFSDGLCVVKEEGKGFGAIDNNGNYDIAPIYDFIGDFNSGRAPFKVGNKWGIFTENDPIMLDESIQQIQSFTDFALTQATQNGKPVYLNRDGEIVSSVIL